MQIESVREYILENTGIDVKTKQRDGNKSLIKTLFCHICKDFCTHDNGRSFSTSQISVFLKINRGSVSYHLNKDLKYILKGNRVLQKIYYHYYNSNNITSLFYQKRINEIESELKKIKTFEDNLKEELKYFKELEYFKKNIQEVV